MANTYKRTDSKELRGTVHVYGDVCEWVRESCDDGDFLIVRKKPESLENRRARQVFMFGESSDNGES